MSCENVMIRPAVPEDAAAIDIILSTYFLDRDDLPHDSFFVAEINDKVIGCGVFEKITSAETGLVFYEIHTIAVLPSYKNKGYGRLLLERLLFEIENEAVPPVSKTIYTRTTAPEFFIRFGFSKADPALKKKLWDECVLCGKFEACAQTLLYKETGYCHSKMNGAEK